MPGCSLRLLTEARHHEYLTVHAPQYACEGGASRGRHATDAHFLGPWAIGSWRWRHRMTASMTAGNCTPNTNRHPTVKRNRGINSPESQCCLPNGKRRSKSSPNLRAALSERTARRGTDVWCSCSTRKCDFLPSTQMTPLCKICDHRKPHPPNQDIS